MTVDVADMGESAGIGYAEIEPDAVPRPASVGMARWLRSFPSFGFLLAAGPKDAPEVCHRFAARGLAAAVVGRIVPGSVVALARDAA